MLFLATHTCLLLSMGFMLASCVTQFVVFISNQGFLGTYGLRYPLLRSKNLGDWTEYERQYVVNRLVTDVLLVALFVLQHSLMARDCWKRLLLTFNIYVSERLIYVIATSFTLQVMGRWASTPDVVLWDIDTEEHAFHWLFFCLLHAAAWTVLFLQVLVMDPLELVGIKQVFNYYKGRGPALSHAPKQLRTFYQHLRHAGPSSLWLMLWVHPTMSLDRFLLAVTLSLYLVTAQRLSLADYKFAHSYFVMRESTTTTTTRHRVY